MPRRARRAQEAAARARRPAGGSEPSDPPIDWPAWRPRTRARSRLRARDSSPSRRRANGCCRASSRSSSLAAPADRGVRLRAARGRRRHARPPRLRVQRDGRVRGAVLRRRRARPRPQPVELKIVGRALIGQRPEGTVGGGEAIAIATGAPIPAGADTIVPIENARSTASASASSTGPPGGTHIRPAGEDVRAGDVAGADRASASGAPSSGCSPPPASRTRSCIRGRA